MPTEDQIAHGDRDHRIDGANDVHRNHGRRCGHGNDDVYRVRVYHTPKIRTFLQEAVGEIRPYLWVDMVLRPNMELHLYVRMTEDVDICIWLIEEELLTDGDCVHRDDTANYDRKDHYHRRHRGNHCVYRGHVCHREFQTCV